MGYNDYWNRSKKKEKRKSSHLTMMIIPHSQGTAVKNYCIPMWVFRTFMVISVTCILIVGYFVGGYYYLKYLAVENKELKEVNVAQAKEISELKGLAGTMRDKLEYLVKLDQEVRAKVGLTKAANEEKALRGVDSSRAETRYRAMTMGLGKLGEDVIALAQKGSTMLYVDQNPLLVAPGLEGIGGNGVTETVLELPVAAGEINTLEELKVQLSEMDELLTLQAENMNKLKSDVERQIAFEKAVPNAWPLQGRITSGFGWRKNPYSSKLREYHEGIDIAASYGSAIRAAGDGVVTFSGYKTGWGRVVIISHGFGYVSQYAHNSSLLVKAGDKITRGQVIARLGSTGRSTGPHLHFGVAQNGKWINPLTVINTTKTGG